MPLLFDCARDFGRRNQILLFVLTLFLVAFAALFAVGPFDPPPAISQRVFYAGVMLVAAGLFARSAMQQRTKPEPGLRTLAERPADIVWIYLFTTKRGTSLVLATVDGERLGVPVPGRRAAELLRDTASRLPRAVAGYAPDVESTYRRDPRAVQRASS